MTFRGFSEGTFAFLDRLRANNNREWFEANRGVYLKECREPALAFIATCAAPLADLAPEFTAIPKAVGGSLFRIHRDVRFSNDKSPYKTHIGIHFRHRLAKDAHAPGYYLHLAPEEVFFGAGIWKPPPHALRCIRESVSENPAAWKRVRNAVAPHFGAVQGERLSSAPRGFPRDHPLIEDIRLKSVFLVRAKDRARFLAPTIVDDVMEDVGQAAPMMRFLCKALSVPW